MPSDVNYGNYADAFKAIHSSLNNLGAPPPGHKITGYDFVWNLDGTIRTIQVFDGEEIIFTIDFVWNLDGTIRNVERTDML
jgi:hypothetical protein